jgi:DNA primase large subunit
MNVVTRQPRTRLKYPFRVHFYDEPPEEEVHIEEFEKLALDRLQG